MPFSPASCRFGISKSSPSLSNPPCHLLRFSPTFKVSKRSFLVFFFLPRFPASIFPLVCNPAVLIHFWDGQNRPKLWFGFHQLPGAGQAHPMPFSPRWSHTWGKTRASQGPSPVLLHSFKHLFPQCVFLQRMTPWLTFCCLTRNPTRSRGCHQSL